jgi:GT2 family glycosyltransferase
MKSPLVYIVLVNYKNWQDTAESLESIFKLHYQNFKVVVVDNDSQNSSIEHLQDWAAGITPIQVNGQFYAAAPVDATPVEKPILHRRLLAQATPDRAIPDEQLLLVDSTINLGFAGGNNVGIRLATAHQADYVWLLNNDTVVARDTLSHLVAFTEEARNAGRRLGITGAQLLYYHNPALIQAVLGRYKPLTATTGHIGLNLPTETSFDDLQIGQDDYIVGASMFVSADFIQEVGPMEEDYFLYFEEIDWVKRGRAKNYEIAVCLDARVYHKEGAAIGGGLKDNNNKSALSDFYSIRNRLIITKKFYRKYLLPVYLSLIFVAANRIKRKQFDRISLIIKAIKSS